MYMHMPKLYCIIVCYTYNTNIYVSLAQIVALAVGGGIAWQHRAQLIQLRDAHLLKRDAAVADDAL